MSSYCAIADVRAYDLVTQEFDDPTVTAAIAEASDAVERYCADYFLPQAGLTVRAQLGSYGIAPLPLTVTDPATSITSVTFETQTTPIAAQSYIAHSSIRLGDFDAIQFAVAGWDDTINGAERETGGFATLFAPGRAVLVVGTFGYPAVPPMVKRMTALLASRLLTADVHQIGAGLVLSQSGGPKGTRFQWEPGMTSSRTTGDATVDRALRQFRRDVVAVRGI